MIRLLGFIVGSAVSIGAILLVLGVPQLNMANPHLDKDRFEDALQQLRDKQHELEQATAAKAAERPATTEIAQSGRDETAPPQNSVTPPAPESTADASTDMPVLVEPQHWHTFWNPFHTEIAARGFVGQLERVTGLDYRVVKVKTGVYEVAFAYDSDTELQAKLSQIQAATGLDLPGS
jgi:hypothetical protein